MVFIFILLILKRQEQEELSVLKKQKNHWSCSQEQKLWPFTCFSVIINNAAPFTLWLFHKGSLHERGCLFSSAAKAKNMRTACMDQCACVCTNWSRLSHERGPAEWKRWFWLMQRRKCTFFVRFESGGKAIKAIKANLSLTFSQTANLLAPH